ncbi:MAG: hypothetical protein JXA14_20350 [Anaerolineae bacterium]|nr:hypothetical protein [Anaerolineae bacterium]
MDATGKGKQRSRWQYVLMALGLVLVLAFVVIEVIATTGCEAAGGHALVDEDDEGDMIRRSKDRTAVSSDTVTSMGEAAQSAQASTLMRIDEWIYTHGGYTTLTGFPFADVFEEHGYLAIKVPEPSGCPNSHIVRTGEYSPTAHLYYWVTPTDRYTVPLTFRDDLVSGVESRYPSGNDHHWEVLWHKSGWNWPVQSGYFEEPELHLVYHFDFCGDTCWGCDFAYLICAGSVCDGPFPERIVTDGGHGVLADFYPMAWQVVSPTVPFTNTNMLCNFDTISHTYDLTYTSSAGWDYTIYTRDNDTSPPVQANTVEIEPCDHFYDTECKYVDLVATTDEWDARDQLLIEATSQISPTEAHAEALNVVITPGYDYAEVEYDEFIYLPLVLRSYSADSAVEAIAPFLLEKLK